MSPLQFESATASDGVVSRLRLPIWTTAGRRARLLVDGSCLSVIALSAITLSRTYLVMPASPKSGMMCFSYAILNNKMMN